jgi:hypothetical protein
MHGAICDKKMLFAALLKRIETSVEEQRVFQALTRLKVNRGKNVIYCV